jgi:hypothetical protein
LSCPSKDTLNLVHCRWRIHPELHLGLNGNLVASIATPSNIPKSDFVPSARKLKIKDGSRKMIVGGFVGKKLEKSCQQCSVKGE